jgi:broad specificity phosphatase PhoE
MPHLYLVRHGQPDFTGDYDSITALGASQSRWLGAHFASRGLRFARVASGTLRRQVDTCDLVALQMPDVPEAVRDARLNEYDHASLLAFFAADRMQELRVRGDRRGYFRAIRASLQAWSRHEGALAGGETWADFGGRIRAVVGELCDGLGRDDNVLLVSSGGVIGRYAAEVLGAGAEAAIQLNLQTRNTGVTEVVLAADGVARLVAFNAIPHLEVPGRESAITYA